MFFAPIRGCGFGLYFAQEEYCRLIDLSLEVQSCAVPLLCSFPVCPDYLTGSYELGQGVGEYAERLLHILPEMVNFFSRRGISLEVELNVADVDYSDSFLERYVKIPMSTMMRKTRRTRKEIENRVKDLKLINIKVGSMANKYREAGIDYRSKQSECAYKINQSEKRVVKRAVAGLVAERLKKGEFQSLSIPPDLYNLAASFELAGYVLYGEMVGGDGITASMSSVQTIAGFNFLKEDIANITPTFFIGGSMTEPSTGAWS